MNDPYFSTAVSTTLNEAGILSNNWDPDGGTLSIFNGSDGAFTFVPAIGYVGLASFTCKIMTVRNYGEILHFGNAFWSSTTPASVTRVLPSFSSLSFVSPVS